MLSRSNNLNNFIENENFPDTFEVMKCVCFVLVAVDAAAAVADLVLQL